MRSPIIPFPRGRPGTDDRTISARFQRMDERKRCNIATYKAESNARKWRPRYRINEDPATTPLLVDDSRSVPVEWAEWIDLADEDEDFQMPQTCRAASRSGKTITIALGEVREACRRDVEKGETAVEADRDEQPAESPSETAQDNADDELPESEDPFHDCYSSDTLGVESLSSVTSPETGQLQESPELTDPFADSSSDGLSESPSSPTSQVSSWKSSDRISDYAFPNDEQAETDVLILEGRRRAASLWRAAESKVDEVVKSTKMELPGLRKAIRKGRAGPYTELDGEE